MLPFISFIVPAKNEEHNIERCLYSILSVDYPKDKFEIIVLDNGSTDRTVEIAKGRGASVYVLPELNISGLRNFGAQNAKGKYLAFIDADVTIYEDWIHVCLETLGKFKCLATGSSPAIPENSTWIERLWHKQIEVRDPIGPRPWIASMNFFVEKNTFLAVGGFDDKLKTCEDVDLGYRLSKITKILYNKNIKAVHYGEAKTVKGFLKKEYWRGISGFESFLRNKSNIREIFSLASFLFFICSVLLLIFSILNLSFSYFSLSLLLFIIFPLIRAVRIQFKTNQIKGFAGQIFIWSLYFMARETSCLFTILKHLKNKVWPFAPK